MVGRKFRKDKMKLIKQNKFLLTIGENPDNEVGNCCGQNGAECLHNASANQVNQQYQHHLLHHQQQQNPRRRLQAPNHTCKDPNCEGCDHRVPPIPFSKTDKSKLPDAEFLKEAVRLSRKNTRCQSSMMRATVTLLFSNWLVDFNRYVEDIIYNTNLYSEALAVSKITLLHKFRELIIAEIQGYGTAINTRREAYTDNFGRKTLSKYQVLKPQFTEDVRGFRKTYEEYAELRKDAESSLLKFYEEWEGSLNRIAEREATMRYVFDYTRRSVNEMYFGVHDKYQHIFQKQMKFIKCLIPMIEELGVSVTSARCFYESLRKMFASLSLLDTGTKLLLEQRLFHMEQVMIEKNLVGNVVAYDKSKEELLEALKIKIFQ